MDGAYTQVAQALPSRALPSLRPRRRAWRGGSEYAWAIAFVVPYAGVFLAFVAYPVFYGLWLGHAPSLYAELFEDPIYQRTVVNTVLYVGIGVNLKMFFALLLSGFFMRRSRWVKVLLLIYVLPWAVPALPAFISIHWMLNGQWGLLNNFLWDVFGIDGPGWIETSRWLALGSVIVSHIWKWMPFWTVILLAGRMAIPQELYDEAEVDVLRLPLRITTGHRKYYWTFRNEKPASHARLPFSLRTAGQSPPRSSFTRGEI